MTITTSSGDNNWQIDFYKNGYPKEVILIEDSPTPPCTPLIQEPSSSTSTSTIAQTPISHHMLPPAASTRSKRALRDQQEYRVAQQERQQLLHLHLQQQKQKRKQRLCQLPSSPIATPVVTKRRRKGQTLNNNNKVIVRIPPNNNNIATSATPTKSSPIADKNGHFIFRQNEFLTDRYKMIRMLGQGTFGKVIECNDMINNKSCAIKVIRSIHKYREASLIEMRVLKTLKEHDPSNSFKCIHLNEWFDHEHHICMVFELLGPSVFDFLKTNHFKPFPLAHIRQFAKQIFTSVAFLHRIKLVHTDLKPENVLLLNTKTVQGKSAKSTSMIMKNTDIRLIDFGSATFEQEYHSAVVSTRHYRAPEIILDIGWSYPCDIWSIGCMLVEFFTGDALFQTHDNLEHLAMMEKVIGKIPNKTINKSQQTRQSFFEKYKLVYPTSKTNQQSIDYVNSLHSLKEIISPELSLENANFYDLLKKIFVYEPQSRITATAALNHPFFQHNI